MSGFGLSNLKKGAEVPSADLGNALDGKKPDDVLSTFQKLLEGSDRSFDRAKPESPVVLPDGTRIDLPRMKKPNGDEVSVSSQLEQDTKDIKLFPNSTFTFGGYEVKTDDNGKIYNRDGINLKDFDYVCDGTAYKTNKGGEIIRVDGISRVVGLTADEVLNKVKNDPDYFVDSTESDVDADRVRELSKNISERLNDDSDVIVREGPSPEYANELESGERSEEEICNDEGLNYDELYDSQTERYGDEYERGFRDGWDSVSDDESDNEAYNNGKSDAEELKQLFEDDSNCNDSDAGIENSSLDGGEAKETRDLTEDEKQALKEKLGWSDKQLAKCTIDEDGVIHYKTDNSEMEGKTSETGVPYERKIIEINGVKIEGVFPKFNSVFDTDLPPEKYKSKAYAVYCNKNLKEAVANDPDLRSKFTEEQLKDIEDGRTPTGYVWHHNEETGKMQLVKDTDHRANRHTGGSALWGPDSSDNSRKGENF